ncbi:MAG: 5-formyltetrahydrofolate cyclo-ligase [Flavisolibacter sp.]
MLKKDARNLYRKKREEISYNERIKWDDLLLIQFQSLQLPFINYVLSFYPIEQQNEINTLLLTDYLHFRNPNLSICYPKTSRHQIEMAAIICNADSIFEANEWNIPEPTDTDAAAPDMLDLVLVPLLAFDSRGTRVGYGKGYFDRYLKHCRPDCLKIGLSYFEAVDTIEDANDFDVPLDFCITPQRTYVF